jgi:hypothetical protein
MLDPTPETHPLLFALAKQHVDYYRDAAEYVSKRSVEIDIHKDSSLGEVLREAGLDPTHHNAKRSFRPILWPVVRCYMNPDAGWWSKSRGRGAMFVHESFATPEDCRDAANLLIQDREGDRRTLARIVELTEEKCGQFKFVFDPQFSDGGDLVRVEVWAA